MKIKILDNFNYQIFPIVEGMVDVDENLISEIGKTKQFNVKTGAIIDYNNTPIVQEEEKQKQLFIYKKQLKQLSEDIIQYIAGEKVPNIENRKKSFINVHNKVREFEGKTKREII